MNPAMRLSGLIAALLLSLPSSAQSPADAGTPEDSEAEIRAIEEALEADAKANAKQGSEAPQAPPSGFMAGIQSLNPDISFIADVALAAFSSAAHLEGGGHDPSKTGFNLQGLELSVGQAVDPYFRFDANLVFSLDGVEIEEVYATTLSLPYRLQMRLGQFLTRFGRQNAQHLHRWDFVDQPFALTRVMGPDGNRGLGLELSYLLPLPWYAEVVGSATDASGGGANVSFYGPNDLGVESPLDFQLTGALKQFFELSDSWGLNWGLSAATGPNATGHRNRTDLYGTDLYLKFRPLTEGSFTQVTFQSEWFYRRRQIPGDLLRDVTGYAQLFWRFAQRLGVAARYEYGAPSLGLSGATGVDDLTPEWISDRHRVSAAFTFWPTEFSRVRVQVDSDHATWLPRADWAVFLAFEFAVGAHGAHAF